MADTARALVERLHSALERRDLDVVGALYAPAGEVIGYDGVARGPQEITEFYGRYLDNHGRYELDRIVEFRAIDDMVLWDSMVLTDEGVLMTYDVAILDDAGLIVRHIPAIRGYWGR